MCDLVTGATGLLGSHVVEALVARGRRVRALVRPGSDSGLLETLGVELVRGDLLRGESLPAALAGVDTVYHCAARVSDWGPWQAFEEGIVQTTANLVRACLAAPVRRLLHVSSVSVYGGLPRGREGAIDEQTPLGRRFRWWDYYGRAKLAAERQAQRLGPRTTIVRPTWIYGLRDRAVIPRMARAVVAGQAALIGRGDNRLNMVHAADVAAGAILAAADAASSGAVYNLASAGTITQRQFFDALCAALELPPLRRRVPLWVAETYGFASEALSRLLRRATPPAVTRRGIQMLSRPTRFSSELARRQLGWTPAIDVAEGLPQALRAILRPGQSGPARRVA